jgi:hypothetical protein
VDADFDEGELLLQRLGEHRDGTEAGVGEG